jgi:hypothetical protein
MTRDKIDQLWDEAVSIRALNARYNFTALVLEEAARVCDEVSKEHGGVAEGPFVTDFGKHTHNAMAAGAQNAGAAVRAMKPEVK